MASIKRIEIVQADWIYLSPHLDDAAFSCGGLIWEQVQAGQRVSIWTVCAGSIPEGPLSPFAQSLHARWKTGHEAVSTRHEEDRLSCQRLGVKTHYLDIPDCIYRFRHLPEGDQPLIMDEPDLTGAQPEEELITSLAGTLTRILPAGVTIVCPAALGSHVDHRLTRAAAELSGLPLYYYPDYPYVLRCPKDLAQVELSYWQRQPFVISTGGLAAWQDAVSAHQSQISTFWQSDAEARLSIQNYWAGGGGRLWARQ